MNEVFLRIAWQWFCPTYAGNSKSINIIWKCEQYSLAAGLGPGRCSFSCKPKLRPGLKLHEINVDDTSHFHFPRSGSFEFLFVTDPTNWETIPYAACRLPRHGIVMKQSAPAMPLMQHTLRDQSSSMTVEDIGRCVKRLKIETSSDDLPSMLSALATKICDGDEEAARKEANLFHKAREPNRNADDMLLDDPLVDLVYEEMDDKDKGEFKEIGDAKDKRKLSATLRKWNGLRDSSEKKTTHAGGKSQRQRQRQSQSQRQRQRQRQSQSQRERQRQRQPQGSHSSISTTSTANANSTCTNSTTSTNSISARSCSCCGRSANTSRS